MSSQIEQWKRLGDGFFRAKDYLQAIESYTSAIENITSNDELLATLYSNRCACYLSLNKLNEALDDAQSCISVRPTWSKGHTRKGGCLVRLGRRREAVVSFERALALDPNNREIQTALTQARNAAEPQSSFWSNPFQGTTASASTNWIEQAKTFVQQVIGKAIAAFASTTEKQRTYAAMGAVALLVYFLFFRSPSYGYDSGYGGYGSPGGGLSWTTWGAVMLAAYKLPPMFPDLLGQYARPFFGMNWTTFMWLLDMFTRNRGFGAGNNFNRFQRRRGYY